MINRRQRMLRWAIPVVASLALLVTGCSSEPPSELKGSAKAVGSQIDAANKALDKAKADFKKKLKQPKYAFMASYTAVQRHEDRFTQAKSKLDKADKLYGDKIKPQVEDYNGNKAILARAITDATKLKDDARKLTADPAKWLDTVAGVKADPKGTVKRSTDSLQTINTDHAALDKRVEAAKTTYSKNADAIGNSLLPLNGLRLEALRANGFLQEEADKSSPNFAVMASQADIVERKTTSYTKDSAALKGKLDQLGTRETHTLVDARVDSEIYISRTSWDEDSDANTDKNHDYPKRTVDVKTANYFAQFGENDVLARLKPSGWNGTKFEYDKADKVHWDKLHIDAKEDLPGGHEGAEFTMELDQTYCHKVLVVKNGKPGASPSKGGYCSRYDTAADRAKGQYWLETDELRTDLIGMDLYAKGFGELPDQANTSGTPPGMVYVGDESTGEWREDEYGNSFWYYYGQYAFINQLIGGGPNPYYYRSEWNDWDRHHRHSKKPYFGNMNGSPRFGAKSPFASTRFPGTNYATNLYGTTVRGAGPSARGGGPSGGGK